MNKKFKMLSPCFWILLGLLLLFFIGRAEAAGICFLIGIAVIILRIWPEKWEADKHKKVE